MSHAQTQAQVMINHSPAHWSPLITAAHNAVASYQHNGKSGAVAMAERIGKPARVINNETNDDYDGAKLGLTTAYLIDCELANPAILYKYAELLHHVCFPLPTPEINSSDDELLSKFSQWQAAMGKTCIAINEALADGRITKKESSLITDAGFAHMRKFMEFVETIKEKSE